MLPQCRNKNIKILDIIRLIFAEYSFNFLICEKGITKTTEDIRLSLHRLFHPSNFSVNKFFRKMPVTVSFQVYLDSKFL